MKSIFYCFFGLLSFSMLCAQNTGQSAGSGPLSKTLLWKITRQDLSQPSFLFGTMHIMCAGNAKLSDSLNSIIKNCDEIYFEINLDDLVGMLGSLKYMQMKDNKRLSDFLSQVDYEKVKNYFVKHASLMPFSMLERFKPMLVSSLIEEQDLECKVTDGMELLIMKEAHLSAKRIQGLETAEFQAGLFDSIPYDRQARELINYIDSPENYKKMTAKLEKVYKEQDLEQIDRLTREGDPSINSYLDLLIYQRNRKWVNSLDTLMPGKSLLIAVGAGHLPGEEGLIKTLRKKGYTVSALKN